jgi:lipopolysaccharide/colanic/teichoic acid biosynthesis glycosyltransferase
MPTTLPRKSSDRTASIPGFTGKPKSLYTRAGKRVLDCAVAVAGLILLSPVMIIAALAVKLTGSGPAFFRQVRIGQFGKPFRIVKFRSMVENADRGGPAITAAGDSRITAVGRWIRKTKIDEIPQLWNVLMGDMSLVGPRPEVPDYAAMYTDAQLRVLFEKPGISGPAANAYVCEEEILAGQLEIGNFYIAEILPRKLELDLHYCDDIRLGSDIKIILATFGKLFERSIRPEVLQEHTR